MTHPDTMPTPLPPIESTTLRALSLALDAAQVRHQVIATNIAHVHTPGHVAQQVSFEALVDANAANPGELRTTLTPAPATDAPLDAAVRLDEQMAALAHNTLHQQMLLRAAQRHLGLLALAAGDGKR